MANLPQQNTITQYQADGIESTYVFNYYIPLTTDINVYVTPVGEEPVPSEDIKILNVDYSVTRNPTVTTGGYITFLPGKIPAAGTTITLSRDVKASLDVEFANATTLNGENLDEAFERLLLLIQQNKTLINSSEQRVLSYRINAFQATANITENTQIPLLGVNQVWKGQGDGVIATTLVEGPDTSTLRSDLANASPGTDGARIVGYFDAVGNTPTTVQAFLADLIPFVQSQLFTQFVPTGTILDFGGSSAPSGFLVCLGAAVSRTTYAPLFAVIGTTFGAGDGTTTFNLPNFARHVAVGAGGTGTSVLGNALGNNGGEETHVQTVNEMPVHDHTYSTVTTGTAGGGGGAGSITGFTGATTGANGGGAAFNIMQPSIVVTKIIKI